MNTHVKEEIEKLTSVDDPIEFSLSGYKAIGICIKVYDGDTIWIKINMNEPWGVVKLRCRLYGFDTSEVRGGSIESKNLGRLARDYLAGLILFEPILVKFGDFDMYGRPLVEVYTIENINHRYEVSAMSVNELMVREGHAIIYLGFSEKKATQDNLYILSEMSPENIVKQFKKLNDVVEVPRMKGKNYTYKWMRETMGWMYPPPVPQNSPIKSYWDKPTSSTDTGNDDSSADNSIDHEDTATV